MIQLERTTPSYCSKGQAHSFASVDGALFLSSVPHIFYLDAFLLTLADPRPPPL